MVNNIGSCISIIFSNTYWECNNVNLDILQDYSKHFRSTGTYPMSMRRWILQYVSNMKRRAFSRNSSLSGIVEKLPSSARFPRKGSFKITCVKRQLRFSRSYSSSWQQFQVEAKTISCDLPKQEWNIRGNDVTTPLIQQRLWRIFIFGFSKRTVEQDRWCKREKKLKKIRRNQILENLLPHTLSFSFVHHQSHN